MRLQSRLPESQVVKQDLYLHLIALTRNANPFAHAPIAPSSEDFRRRLVTVRAGEFMVSDDFNIPTTSDMAPCIAVGLIGKGKAAVAHFTMSNDPDSLVDVVRALYPDLSVAEGAQNVKAIMRGGVEELDDSKQLAVGLLEVMKQYGIQLLGAQVFSGTASGEAFGIDPRDSQIYIGATGIHSVQLVPTPLDYYKVSRKPLLQVGRKQRMA